MLYSIRAAYKSGLLTHNTSNTTDRQDHEGGNDALLRQVMFASVASVSDARMLFIGFEDQTFGGFFENGTFDTPSQCVAQPSVLIGRVYGGAEWFQPLSCMGLSHFA